MNPLVVVGVCIPERRRYAAALAQATGRRLVRITERSPARRPDSGPSAPQHPLGSGELWRFVADVATELDLPHLDLAGDPRIPVVCVVDALHLLDDIADQRPLVETARPGDDRGDFGARARRAVSLIEGATLVSFVNWESVGTSRLALLMSIASHLNPAARVRLSRGPVEDVSALASAPQEFPPLLERAGWVHALNEEHDPHMTDSRVSTIRYEQQRPFHPARLTAVLDDIESGRYGLVLRSAGFCRLATRSSVLARWDHVGSAIWIDPLTSDLDAASTGQDISFTGLRIDAHALSAALDTAAVSDDELTAGPDAWRMFDDPLPAWPTIVEEHP
ncbi:GTP-binding protein [Microbacterium sp. PMB16]|uniref:GTP-binding protein n=1 Tax=Microbacterium sp. PMB16 TaxID=3120157 RepID=UPI003F4BCAA8